MDGQQREVEQGLSDKVTIAHGVERVLETTVEPQLVGDQVRVDPERRSRQRSGAERRHVEAAPGGEHPVDVACESPPVCKQMVRQEHGLRALQMRVAGQVGVADLRRATCQGPLQPENMADHPCELASREKPERRRDLVVPAPAGMELRPALGRELGDASLDRRVDVLVGLEEGEAAARQLGTRLSQGLDQGIGLCAGQDPRPHEAVDVSDRALHVAVGEPLVEGQAGGERQQGVRRRGAHPAGPECHSAPPWRADQVWTPRPNSRTKPSASWWRKASAAS